MTKVQCDQQSLVGLTHDLIYDASSATVVRNVISSLSVLIKKKVCLRKACLFLFLCVCLYPVFVGQTPGPSSHLHSKDEEQEDEELSMEKQSWDFCILRLLYFHKYPPQKK